MINPHISLNPQNSQISSAILRFHEDFHCEIHGFHEQSSDLAGDLFRLNPQADLRVRSSALSESQFFGLEVAFYTISVGLTFYSDVMCSIESWISQLGHRSQHRSIYICLFQIYFLNFLLYSSSSS